MSKEPNKTTTKEPNELSAKENGKENGEAVIDQQEAATNQQEEKDLNDSNQSQQGNSNQFQQQETKFYDGEEQKNKVDEAITMESTIQLTDEKLKQKLEWIISNYNRETIAAILRNIFKKLMVDADAEKNLPINLREIIEAWKSDNYLEKITESEEVKGVMEEEKKEGELAEVKEGAMEEGSKKISDEQKKVALVRNTMKAFRDHFLSKGFSEEDLRGMGDDKGNDGLFAEDVIKKVGKAGVDDLKQTMLIFCKYLTLLSQKDQETIKKYLALYPPQADAMLCLGGTAARIQELVLQLMVSQQEGIFFAIHQKLISEFVIGLRNYVIPGNEIHIESYVNHFFCLIAEGKNLDFYYMSPQSEILTNKMWDFYFGYADSFKAKLREEAGRVIEVINFIKEHKVDEVISDAGILPTLLSNLEARYGINISSAELSGLMGYDADGEAVWSDEKIKKLVLDNNPLFKISDPKKDALTGQLIPTGLPIPKSEDLLKSATADQIVDLITSNNQQEFNAGIAALWILGVDFTGSSISQFAKVIEGLGSEFTESIESTIRTSKKLVSQDFQRFQIKEIQTSKERIEQFYKSDFYLEHSKHKPLDLLLYEGATEEEVKEFFQLERKETRPEDIFSPRFLDDLNVDMYVEYMSRIPKNLMLRSDRVEIFKIFSEKEIILPYQFLINCLIFCTKSNDARDIELAGVLLGYLQSGYLNNPQFGKGIIELEIFEVAAQNGNVALIASLIKELIIDHKEENGLKALHFVVSIGNLKIVELLIANGVDINQADDNSPLLLASSGGHFEIVKLLIEKGAKVNQFDKHRNSALHFASSGGHLKIVELLLANGANVNHANKNKDTALLLAAEKGHLEIVKLLLTKGVNVNHANKNKDTALLLATQNRHLEIVKLLLTKGANVNHANKNKDTALLLAAWKGHLEIVKLLLTKGVNVNHANENKDTALLLAAWKGQLEIVELLLAKGADADLPNNNQSPLSSAVLYKHHKVAALLIAKKVGVSFLDKPDELQAYYAAAEKGYFEMIEFLLYKDTGANAKKIADLEEVNPLHLAAFNGDIAMASVLLANGADVNQLDQNGDTALHSATIEGHLKMAELLIANGAAIDQKNNDGYTPLHCAVCQGNIGIVEILASKDTNAVIELLKNPLFEREKEELSKREECKTAIEYLEGITKQNPSTEITSKESGKLEAEKKENRTIS